MLTSPTELHRFLRTLGVEPKRGLSQNFLIDGNIIRKTLAQAEIEKDEPVLEIGPGPGALTEALVAAGARVYAVEKDPVYAEALKRFSQVTVWCEDILEVDFSHLPSPCKVVSNLPYHLTAPILTRLAPRRDLFTTLTLMVQEEVARRMSAQPKTKEYSSLTLFLQFYADVHYAFKVSRHCFYPQPKVDSAIVTLKLRDSPAVNAEAFFHMVRTAFQQRRKMVKSTLGPAIGPLLASLGENPQARPEDLSLDLFLKLFSILYPQPGD